MSTVTVTDSPIVRLMGKRPPSTDGCTFSMMTRRVSSPGGGAAVGSKVGADGDG
jgi:hypothetical protein